jgi:hypothetical protein
MAQIEAETRASADRMKAAHKKQGVASLDEHTKRRAGIRSGTVLPGRADAIDDFGRVRSVADSGSAKDRLKQLGTDDSAAKVRQQVEDTFSKLATDGVGASRKLPTKAKPKKPGTRSTGPDALTYRPGERFGADTLIPSPRVLTRAPRTPAPAAGLVRAAGPGAGHRC